MGNFIVEDAGIQFVPSREGYRGAPPLLFLNFATGETEHVLDFGAVMLFPGLSISPGGKSVLHATFEGTESDLMLVENFR